MHAVGRASLEQGEGCPTFSDREPLKGNIPLLQVTL